MQHKFAYLFIPLWLQWCWWGSAGVSAGCTVTGGAALLLFWERICSCRSCSGWNQPYTWQDLSWCNSWDGRKWPWHICNTTPPHTHFQANKTSMRAFSRQLFSGLSLQLWYWQSAFKLHMDLGSKHTFHTEQREPKEVECNFQKICFWVMSAHVPVIVTFFLSDWSSSNPC